MKYQQVYRMILWALLLPILLLSACAEEDLPAIQDDETLGDPQSLYNLAIQADPNLSTFIDAVVKAGLTLDLREGDGTITVFAPTNQAFQDAGINIDDLSTAELRTVLDYHIIADSLPSSQIESKRYVTPTGKFLEFSTEGGVTINEGQASVTTPDLTGSNGILHVVDGVLLPSPNIQESSSDQGLSSFLAAVGRFDDLSATVEDETADITIFAPSDQAFQDFLDAFPQYNELADVPDHVLRTLLEYHVIGEELFSGDLQGQSATTLQGEDINADNVLPKVTDADINSSNGVIHVVDEILVPNQVSEVIGSVLGIAYLDPEARFTTLIEALQKAELYDILLGEGPFTVFAPTNDAFEAAGISVADLSTEELQPVLLYHVLSGNQVLAEQLDVGPVDTESGTFFVNIPDQQVFINGQSNVVLTDLQADNGVVHVIDLTLTPPSMNLVEIASSREEFSELAAAVVKAGLDDELAAAGPFTVFAPTNEAFQALYDALGVAGLEEIDAADLEPILLHHVFSGDRIFSPEVNEGTISTMNGDFSINITDGETTEINILQFGAEDATITGFDVLGTNGVIHVLDKVILPDLSEN